MYKALIRSLSALATLTLLCQASGALAQSTYGTIMGTVADTQGGVIGGAKVEITNKSTGLARSVVTDDQGAYKVVNLDPGTYIKAVGASGMVQARRSDVQLLARETVRADFQLQASALSQQVEVRAKAFSMSLGKDFKFTERWKLHYEAQFSNLFNVTNLGVPNTRFANGGAVNSSFGRITSTQQGEQAGPRTIQMSLRISF